MALDTRARKSRDRRGQLRAAFFDVDAPPARLPSIRRGVCFGSLTAPVNIPVGSGIGQIPEAQPERTNYIFDSSSPSVDAVNWILNGTATIAAATNDQWDAGFIPQLITSAAAADSLEGRCGGTVTPANNYSMQAVVTVDSDSGCVTPAAQFTITLRFRDAGAATIRNDSVTINPASGAVISSSATVTTVRVVPFVAIGADGDSLLCYTVSLTSIAPALSASVRALYTPQTGRDVVAGGFQIEEGDEASAYIPSGFNSVGFRELGKLPRQEIDSLQPFVLPSAAYTYHDGFDDGKTYLLNDGDVFTLSNTANDGETVTLVSRNLAGAPGQSTVAYQGGGSNLFGPGWTAAGVASFLMPSVAVAPGVGYYSVLMTKSSFGWVVTKTNCGVFDATGTFALPAVGAAGTIIRSNGSAWVASTATYANTIASGNVVYAIAQDNIGGGNNAFNFDSSALRLTVGAGTTTQQGVIIGNYNSGGSGVWSTRVTPDNTNYALWMENGGTIIGVPSGGTVYISSTSGIKFAQGPTAGLGPAITAGTAASPVSLITGTQQRNYSAAATDYMKYTFTTTGGGTATHASDNLVNYLTGASGAEASVFTVKLAGGITTSNLSNTAAQSSIAGFLLGSDGNGQVLDSVAAHVTVKFNGTVAALYSAGSGFMLPQASNPIGLSFGTSGSPTANLSFVSAGVIGVGTGAAGSFDGFLKLKELLPDFTNTAGGTTGNQTINKAAGQVNYAAGATTITVTNSLVTTASQVFCTIATNDATATLKNVVTAAGSFTATITAAATAETRLSFIVFN